MDSDLDSDVILFSSDATVHDTAGMNMILSSILNNCSSMKEAFKGETIIFDTHYLCIESRGYCAEIVIPLNLKSYDEKKIYNRCVELMYKYLMEYCRIISVLIKKIDDLDPRYTISENILCISVRFSKELNLSLTREERTLFLTESISKKQYVDDKMITLLLRCGVPTAYEMLVTIGEFLRNKGKVRVLNISSSTVDAYGYINISFDYEIGLLKRLNKIREAMYYFFKIYFSGLHCLGILTRVEWHVVNRRLTSKRIFRYFCTLEYNLFESAVSGRPKTVNPSMSP